MGNGEDFDVHVIGMLRGFSFGLAGASLVMICQFATVPTISAVGMSFLIASMPILACAGLLAAMTHGSTRRKESRLAACVVGFFALGFATNLMAIALTLWSISHIFGIAFGVGSAIGYGVLMLIFRLVKKEDRE